ncbi:MAG: hypothetical protein WD069_07140 [Planctomycetales bacterium]
MSDDRNAIQAAYDSACHVEALRDQLHETDLTRYFSEGLGELQDRLQSMADAVAEALAQVDAEIGRRHDVR